MTDLFNSLTDGLWPLQKVVWYILLGVLLLLAVTGVLFLAITCDALMAEEFCDQPSKPLGLKGRH